MFNLIEMVTYHNDGRFYTWSGDYSVDGQNWISIRKDMVSPGGPMFIDMGRDVVAKYLRFGGYSNRNAYFHLHKLQLNLY